MDKLKFYAESILKNKYADFSGRARREEFWYFMIFNLIVSAVVGLVAAIPVANVVASIISLAILIPTIAVAVRRLHDANYSGWWLLLSFVPLIGHFVLIIFWTQEGIPADNKWGANPKNQVPPSF